MKFLLGAIVVTIIAAFIVGPVAIPAGIVAYILTLILGME